MPLPAGSQIGPYEIVALLGSGGMGDVYRARNTRLNRHVAIKFLADAIADPLAISRFQQEALTASSLNHPHILTVFESGEIDGKNYLVAELVDGGTLKEWVNHETRTWKQMYERSTQGQLGRRAHRPAAGVKPAVRAWPAFAR